MGIVKAMCLFFIFFVNISSVFLNSTQRVYPIDTIIHHSREKRYKHRPRTGERNIVDVPCIDYSKSIPVLILNRDCNINNVISTHRNNSVCFETESQKGPHSNKCVQVSMNDKHSSQNKENSSTMWLINARSLRANGSTIHDYILDKSPEIVVLTETWLKENDDYYIKELTPPGFTNLHIDCTDRRGGGVALICKDAFKPKQ